MNDNIHVSAPPYNSLAASRQHYDELWTMFTELWEQNTKLRESLANLLQDAQKYGMGESEYSGSLIEAALALAKASQPISTD